VGLLQLRNIDLAHLPHRLHDPGVRGEPGIRYRAAVASL
jgi:hypothetical protein